MRRYRGIIFGGIAALISIAILAAPAEPQPPADTRTYVEMPPQAQALLRQEMLQHMAAVSNVLSALTTGDWKTAAATAETELGRSSMGKHRGNRYAPGMHMPPAMRQIGFSMHDAASELAEHAKKGDAKQAYAAMARVTGACVACHYGYRTR